VVLAMVTLSLPEIFEFSNAFTISGVLLGLVTTIRHFIYLFIHKSVS
jgi:hypothetical protein